MNDLRCWFMDGLNTTHPEPIEFYAEWNKALCKPCERWYAIQRAKREHPAGKAVAPNLPPLDPRKCYSHNREDKLSCPECIGYSEERAVYLND